MWMKTTADKVKINQRVRFEYKGVTVSSEVTNKYTLNGVFHVELFLEPQSFAMSRLKEVEVWD